MKIIYFLPFLLFFSCESSTAAAEIVEQIVEKDQDEVPEKPKLDLMKTRNKANEALAYCQSKNFNTDFCILIDMSLHSGINRLVVWDFAKDTVDHVCLVGHGSGDYPWNSDLSKENPKFSNVENSHCSSLGKYRIGQRAPSDWGVKIKYVIHGLDSTNSNAAKRFVVFHSWERVADEEVFPAGTPEGWGCPIVSINNFKHIDAKLKTQSKSTLMWIYTE